MYGCAGRLPDPGRPHPPPPDRGVARWRALRRRAGRGCRHRTARCLAAAGDPAGRAVRGGPSGGPAATVRTSAGAVPGTRRVDDGLPRDVGGPSRSVCRRTRPAGQDPTKAQGGRQMTQADARTTAVASKVKVQNVRPDLTFKEGTEDAVSFYVSVFPNSKAVSLLRAPPGGP